MTPEHKIQRAMEGEYCGDLPDLCHVLCKEIKRLRDENGEIAERLAIVTENTKPIENFDDV